MINNLNFIAEAGSNHGASFDNACNLVDIAKYAAADSIKFQFIFPENLYIESIPIDNGKSRLTNPAYYQRQREVLDYDDWKKIWEYAGQVNIPISASVFCTKGLEMLKSLGAEYVKIASTDLTNHALIIKACDLFEVVYISTGMASLAEVSQVVNILEENRCLHKVTFMHCVSSYPCEHNEVAIHRIPALQQICNRPIGFSDHTTTDHAAAMALMVGTTLFEKHFTFDKNEPGFDHKYALDQYELVQYIAILRKLHQSLQKNISSPQLSELHTRKRARRGFYTSKKITRGHILTAQDILHVRPSTLDNSSDIGAFIGLPVEKDIDQFSPLSLQPRLNVGESLAESSFSHWEKEMKEKNL